MILLLLALVLALGVTGWLLGTDAYWGDENLETLHEALAYGLLGCALIHVAGVLLVSWRTRVNLLKAMLTGYKVRSDDALPFRDRIEGRRTTQVSGRHAASIPIPTQRQYGR